MGFWVGLVIFLAVFAGLVAILWLVLGREARRMVEAMEENRAAQADLIAAARANGAAGRLIDWHTRS